MSRSSFGSRLGSRRLLASVLSSACLLTCLGLRPSDAECDRSIRRVQIRRRHHGRHDLVATSWSSPSCSEGDTSMVVFWLPGFWLWFVPWLVDGPLGGFWEVFYACLCLLVCLGYKLAVPFACGGCPASSLSSGDRHLRACPCDRLLPLHGTPIPVRLLEGVLRAAGVGLSVQTLFAKEVSTHPTMVSTQHLSIKGKKVDALSGQVDTGSCSQNNSFQNWGQQVDTASEQVDTGPCSQNILFSVWDSVSTPPPGQVDTLRKDCNLDWMFATCQPRAMGYQPRIVCPCTQRVSLESFEYKRSLIGPPSHQKRPNQLLEPPKSFLAATRGRLPPLLFVCFQKTNSHQFKCENWSVIPVETSEASQGSRSSRSLRWRRIQGRSNNSKVQSIGFGLEDCKPLPNPSFYKGVHLKNEIFSTPSLRSFSGHARVMDLERRGKRWGQRCRVICRALLAGSGSPRLLWHSFGADQLVLLTASLCVGSEAT
ncbi:hypothetical protein Taro_033683 [Colocasia esculenta]|uniref:Uncharacterized protein n=1 Tax=Colocasia esculenta TaxID=4460 RepID=A0A843VVW4_COLES|nr:hypothetical protein [Colocasia esculenta]